MGMKIAQGSLFEEDYLLRTLGPIAHVPDVALTELVANAWDAGAASVAITIPSEKGRDLIVEDDGSGMTAEQFKQRWMTLAYDRRRHQGEFAEVPPDRKGLTRRAFGQNGVGRHGMLCFADHYVVETRVAGAAMRFSVATMSGHDPFVLVKEQSYREKGHGTRLIASVLRKLPQADRIRDVLAARFIYDPQFRVSVNGVSVPLREHKGLTHQRTLRVTSKISAEAYCIEAAERGRTAQQHGVAFWVGGRLVGEPSWTLGNRLLLDGRTAAAKRLTIVIELSAMFEDVEPDWSRFKRTENVESLYEAVGDYVVEVTRAIMAEQVQETTESAIKENVDSYSKLSPLAQVEVVEFTRAVATEQPTIADDALSAAVQALIRLEETRSGKMLLDKLAKLGPDDVDGLNKLLDDWTVRDALTVLDEISKRISIVEALDKLSGDSTVNELKTLHPMVTQARWLFGPEYESAFFVANKTVRTVVEEIVKAKLGSKGSFINPKNRPDLVVLPDSTLCAVAAEDMNESGIAQLTKILLIELKKGGFTIGREEMQQAEGYIEDILNSGLIDGSPTIQAFVVGHQVSNKIMRVKRIGDGDRERGRIEALSFDQLVRTANARLFRLRDQVKGRYEGLDGDGLVAKLRAQGRLEFS